MWGEYDAELRTAVLAIKHRGRDELVQPLAGRLASRISLEQWADRIEHVTHVPSHRLRRLRRGRSASAAVAEEVASCLGLPHSRTLIRRGLQRQSTRTRPQRLLLPGHSFRCTTRLRGRRVLLVDDVTTTGTTLRRAADSLLAAGAGKVFCAAVARTPDPGRSA